MADDGTQISREVVERTAREEWGYVLAALTGQLRDLELAEDVLQDALIAALEHWPTRGIPEVPRAWLLQTARRKAIDRIRRAKRFESRDQALIDLEQSTLSPPDAIPDEEIVDERLSMIFTCCHPALGEQARVALTLRTLGGLTTSEIARAFLAPETTMAQRLVRAKRKIKAAGIPYRVPPLELWPERLESVLSVVYFIFNEGYQASSGKQLNRADLCEEAIRLGRILAMLAPREPEVLGLLALMLLHDSRRPARNDDDGSLVSLEEQDRSKWNRDLIDEGKRVLLRALALRNAGPYQIQASISAVHADAADYAGTDWRQVIGLYDRLFRFTGSWVVRLNRAVAVSYADGPEAGLEELRFLERSEGMERYQPFHAAHADLLARAGRIESATAAYERAIELSGNSAEREFLTRKLDRLR